MAVGEARVHGGWIEASQTLHPRWFAVARFDDQSTAWNLQPSGQLRVEPYKRAETVVGYRLTPDVTLRGAYLTRQGYVVSFWDDQFVASIVIAKRLF